MKVAPGVYIDEEALQEKFVHASGPGGQNVNKVATAVQLGFDTRRARGLSDAVRRRLLGLAGSRATLDGVVWISASRFRSQSRNRADARERLAELVRQASRTPRRRIATAPSRAERERRLEDKRRRSGVKTNRRQRVDFD